MKKFKFENIEYNITKEGNGDSDGLYWETKKTDVTRERTYFAFIPIWVGKKFRWFKKVSVKEQLEFVRYSGFDDGWTYKQYWKPWNKCWEIKEILN